MGALTSSSHSSVAGAASLRSSPLTALAFLRGMAAQRAGDHAGERTHCHTHIKLEVTIVRPPPPQTAWLDPGCRRGAHSHITMHWHLFSLALGVVFSLALGPPDPPFAASLGSPCGPSLSSERSAVSPWGSLGVEGTCVWKTAPLPHAPKDSRRQCCCRYVNKKKPLAQSDKSEFDIISRLFGVSNGVSAKRDPTEFIQRCLPHAVVIGSQKSGSTALFGYLISHPNVSTPLRKEMHYFDRRAPKLGLLRYFRFFADSRPTASLVTAEATPSYILGVDTPRRLHSVVPDARLILITRDPVDRMNSEYHMKLRRVHAQLDLVSEKDTFLQVVSLCSDSHGVNVSGVQ